MNRRFPVLPIWDTSVITLSRKSKICYTGKSTRSAAGAMRGRKSGSAGQDAGEDLRVRTQESHRDIPPVLTGKVKRRVEPTTERATFGQQTPSGARSNREDEAARDSRVRPLSPSARAELDKWPERIRSFTEPGLLRLPH